ncbi:hypothetical protein [Rhodococcus sp. Eu-32]|nr:hypothetical protein [Rhodococcus sp. Eu-32]
MTHPGGDAIRRARQASISATPQARIFINFFEGPVVETHRAARYRTY